MSHIIVLNEERLRRQLKRSQELLTKMAIALNESYAINKNLHLATVLGYSPALSNVAALEQFILDQVQLIDEPLARSVFQVLCDRLQRELTRLPAHMQGGLQ